MKNKKPTLASRIINHIANNGPSTKREILSALGLKTTSYTSYFDPITNPGTAYLIDKKHLEDKIASSLVASGRIMVLGKKERQNVYGLGPNFAEVI